MAGGCSIAVFRRPTARRIASAAGRRYDIAMRNLAGSVAFLAALALGLAAGAVLAEGAVLVPWWRSLPPESFLTWYTANASRLFWFFGSLEMVSAALVVAAALLVRSPLLVAAALLTVGVLAVFPLYFQAVNASFEAATIAPGDVAAELGRWARWHWLRTAMAIAAFAAAVAGFAGRRRSGI
jgi:hypothetical protein